MNKNYRLRNQYGMALWVKIVLGLFAAGLLLAIVASIFVVGFFKDAMDPKKTQIVANQIVTLQDPLQDPFEYGRMNVSMGGYSVALINNTESKALFILMQFPKKESTGGAKQMIDQVAGGQSGLPDARGGQLPGDSSASGGLKKNNMIVEKKDVLDVAGSKMYYVLGKAEVRQRHGAGAQAQPDAVPATVDTFFGAADSKNPNNTTFLMVQQEDPSKHLTVEQVQEFLGRIKSL